jgi:hypothetical protein
MEEFHVKNKPLSRRRSMRYVGVMLLALVCALPLCGLTVFAAEEGSPDLPTTAPAIQETAPPPVAIVPLPPYPEDTRDELFPADVQTVIDGDTRQIVKTYVLVPEQSPADIPRDTFERDGWRYSLTDITEKRTGGTDTRVHTETVAINTDSKDLNAIIALLSPTLEYAADDGYCGLLTLDLASVKCEAAGHKNSSYTVTATRDYPHLSANDLSLIPKTITESGRTLDLDTVSWEAQRTVNVDYEDIPESYRAIAKYTATASKTVVTGYVTTADYTGEISKTVTGDTVYTAYFDGKEINPSPELTDPDSPTGKPSATDRESGGIPVLPIAIGLAALALLAGAAAFLFLRRNVKVYSVKDGTLLLVAKDRISAKNPTVNLTPLKESADGRRFALEIDRFTAKGLNGKTVEVVYGPASLKHKIAYEGNAYKIEADFGAGTVQAIY